MKEETYTPMVPTATFTSTSGNVSVVTKFYGDVANGGLDRAKAAGQHRADQLNLTRIEKVERIREPRMTGDYSDM